MASERGLLRGILDVLLADTGDLRRLAEIGGEDPETVYIGTPLDGVDLRGQDLRGMRLTHLDLRRVQHDAKTLIDSSAVATMPSIEPSPLDDIDWSVVTGLVLLEFPASLPGLRNARRDIDDGLLLFSLDEEDLFRQAGDLFFGPKFVVLDHSRVHGLSERLRPFDASTVTLVSRHGQLRRPRAAELAATTNFPGHVVMVPVPTLARRMYEGPLTGPLLDAMLLFVENWTLLTQVLPRGELSVFVRALGGSAELVSEGWCRVLSMLVRSDLAGCDGARLIADDIGTVDSRELGDALLPGLAAFSVQRPPRARLPMNSAAIVFPRLQSQPTEFAYSTSVRGLLAMRGWYQTAFEPSGFFEPDLHIKGQSWSCNVHSRGRLEADNRCPDLLDNQLREIDFTKVETLVASESANERATLWNLARNGWLWVSTADLRHFDARSQSIWPLVAAQALRIARSTDVKSRRRYLAILLRTALRDEAVGNGDPTILIDALNDHEFADRYDLKVERIVAAPNAAQFELRISPETPLFNRGSAFRVELHVNEFGPAIADVGPF